MKKHFNQAWTFLHVLSFYVTISWTTDRNKYFWIHYPKLSRLLWCFITENVETNLSPISFVISTFIYLFVFAFLFAFLSSFLSYTFPFLCDHCQQDLVLNSILKNDKHLNFYIWLRCQSPEHRPGSNARREFRTRSNTVRPA